MGEGGVGGVGGFFRKGPLCPLRNRLWSVSLCGVGGLALHGKAAGVLGGVKEGKREVFTSFSHPTRRQGRRTLNPKPSTLNPKT